MRRSLVLAGGGMRVAWQAGVLQALEEEGLRFDHVDGTSGGILNAAALLSGTGPAELCARWRTLDPTGFASALPLTDYLRGPWSLPGLGDVDGLLGRVFPHLGIDVAAVRAGDREGTFNVVDFVTKQCVAVPHTDVDAPLLAAGMSLAGLVPPLERDGHVWTDAVWVQDANIGEALRRGAEEVWLLWCIGNAPAWGAGPLEHYVHMIEMSANGALFAELAAARTPFVLHVVHPRVPLPLDPEYAAGRVGGDQLVAMGYRDARDYLATADPAGVPHDATCTAMQAAPEGVRFRERWSATLDGADLLLDTTVELPLPREGRADRARLVGTVEHAPWGPAPVLLADGEVRSSPAGLVARATARVQGREVALSWTRDLHDDPGPDAWSDARRALLRVDGQEPVDARIHLGDTRRLLSSIEPTGAPGVRARASVVARFAARGWRDALAPVQPEDVPSSTER